ncbi:transcription initiation factor IID, 31kD subunit-domain-containing protein [Entophlyctis helioformis]|nr:transcription initiation factor IID, 31kD subunit-domain-containing protein [Entophlyctis helioformis]
MPTYDAFKGDPTDLPRDARLVSLILQSLDIDDYEPRVIPQLLEFVHRHILDLLQDAQMFADHAGHKDLEVTDVRLAIESRASHAFSGPPSREVMMELAEKKNSIPLPLIPEKFGLRLPPERNTLLKPNFQIVPKVLLPPSSACLAACLHACTHCRHAPLTLASCRSTPTRSNERCRCRPPALPPQTRLLSSART